MPLEKKVAYIQTNRSQHPYCGGDCEEMFSKKGEQVVCKECYRGKGNFILRDKLKATSEMFTEGSKGWIIPQTESRNINLDYEAYLYFGASIIWRASAGKWPSHVGRMRRGLGKYEDKIRRYLLGETDFPKKVFLLIGLNSTCKCNRLGSWHRNGQLVYFSRAISNAAPDGGAYGKGITS